MNAPPSVLLLHEPDHRPPDLEPLARALEERGARVEIRACAEPYAEVLRAVAAADKVVFWR